MATILVVDDERPLRNLLALVFADSGHRVMLAANGRQALELMRQERPNLVLADVMMPELNGVELCRRIRAVPALAGVPVILMSAAGARADTDDLAAAFLTKPFDLDEVETLVGRLLAMGQSDAEAAQGG